MESALLRRPFPWTAAHLRGVQYYWDVELLLVVAFHNGAHMDQQTSMTGKDRLHTVRLFATGEGEALSPLRSYDVPCPVVGRHTWQHTR